MNERTSARARPQRMRFARTCGTCALPVTDGMRRCPWCTTDFAGPFDDRLTVRASMTSTCADCGDPVRADWSACPWCGTLFRWSLSTATEAMRGILREAGAHALARRIRVGYARGHFSLAGYDDRSVDLVASSLRDHARGIGFVERARRFLGRGRFLALDHPLHVLLHEAGHVFESYLGAALLEREGAGAMIGDLRTPYPDDGAYEAASRAAWWRADDRAFISAYATVHPCEDFAETFAVTAFLRADRPTLRAYARYHRRGPAVLLALEWMAGLVEAHGG